MSIVVDEVWDSLISHLYIAKTNTGQLSVCYVQRKSLLEFGLL